MSDKPRIYQVLDYFGWDYKEVDFGHKIYCPCHADSNPSAKVFPESDTLHCFVTPKTYSPESLYAHLAEVPWYIAKERCAQLFPKPLTDVLYDDDGNVDVTRMIASVTKANPMRDFNEMLRFVHMRVIELGRQDYEQVLVEIKAAAKTDFPLAQAALHKLAKKVNKSALQSLQETR